MHRHAFAAAAACALLASPAMAAPKDEVARIVASPAFKTAVATLDKDYDRTVADIVTLTENGGTHTAHYGTDGSAHSITLLFFGKDFSNIL